MWNDWSFLSHITRLAAVSAVISLGALAVITIAVSMTSISSSGLVEKDASASQLSAKVLGLKESDMRLLQVQVVQLIGLP